MKKKWESKVMHGQYIRNMDGQLSEEDTFLWLSKGDLKAETVREISGRTRPGATHLVSWKKNIESRDRQQMQVLPKI